MNPATVIDTRALAAEIAAIIDERTTPPLLDANAAGALLAVPPSWVLGEARAGRIPHIKLGKYTRFNRDDLLAWTEGRSTGPRPRKAAR